MNARLARLLGIRPAPIELGSHWQWRRVPVNATLRVEVSRVSGGEVEFHYLTSRKDGLRATEFCEQMPESKFRKYFKPATK